MEISELISSAIHFGYRFNGTSCSIYASVPGAGFHNYLQYTLDGVYQKRIKISGDDHQPQIISWIKKRGTYNLDL